MSDRLALIIANSEFDDPKLSRLVTPSHDAEALAEVLGDPAIGDFDVTLCPNKTRQAVDLEVARLYQRRKKGDLLLLYYSGHGIKDDYGDLYLAVKDTRIDYVSATAIEATSVRRQLDKSSSQRKIVVLDCCHSGAFAGAKAVVGSSVGTQEAFAGSGYGRVVLTASNAVEFAWEGDKLLGEAEKSVFTHFLVQGLQTGAADLDNDGQISLDELYDYVYEQVVTSGRSRQTPQKWAQKVEGQIIIAQNPRPVAKPAELPLELQQAIESPFPGVREGAVSDLERLLHGRDKGLALAAHEALTHLADDDSRRVSAAAARMLGISPTAVPAKPSPAPPPPIVEKAKPEPEPELHPSLTLKLSVKPQTVDTGGEATWTATLRNDGEDDLRHVTVRRGRTLLDEPFDLAAGKGRRFTFTTTYKTEGQKIERVTATGITGIGGGVREEASATVQVRPPRPVTPKPEPAPKRKTPAKPTPDVLTLTSPIHLELVRVPAGEFLMGSDPVKDKDADDREQPQHRVYLSEFYIGKTQVTNAQYAAFVKATKCKAPTHWNRGKIPSGKENHPVVNVSWDDAVAFCQWLSPETGKPFRLPTEAEWEKAARGTDGCIYPWGNGQPTAKLCNFEDNVYETTPVGRYSPQGDSPYGCADMAGNVWEWCADWFDEQEYQHRAKSVVKDPQGPKKGTFRVLRGGALDRDLRDVRCAFRDGDAPDDRYGDVGFRVVVSPVPSGPFDFAQDKL
ncbi:MAG: SUMF1/EgtB/PvdO family nonheme iron enzyme [Anaerolineae bacterium]